MGKCRGGGGGGGRGWGLGSSLGERVEGWRGWMGRGGGVRLLRTDDILDFASSFVA